MSVNKNKANNAKFITTFNDDSATLLRYMGFKELEKQNGYFVFINEPKKIMFETLDDVVYTNMLFF